MDKNNTQDAITSWMTFSDAQFDALTTLNLNGTSFANMGNTGQMTFYNASFPILKVLDISKTIFASDETKLAADATFCLTNLPSLTDIYLPDTSAGN
ncbi:hypothetical protein FACS1894166_11530 [Bacilli bacterium]|nr:hypothetical protein FACS1894166_11530 [Bacilli bacterium]